MTDQLVQYNAMRAAIVKAHSVDEVKDIRDRAEALRHYAKQSGEGIEQINLVTEIKLRAERRAGELLKEMEKEKGGRPSKTPTVVGGVSLADMGITYNQSSNWQSIAAIPEAVFENHIAETKASKDEITTASTLRLAQAVSAAPGYDGNEWYSPVEIIEAARAVMGEIDFDPASNPIAQQVVKAYQFCTKDDDSLREGCEWSGRVWLNPPYSMPLIQAFVRKLITQYEIGNVESAIILVNNATDTRWFHELLERGYPVCFTRGRVQFWRTGSEVQGARQGQAAFYLGQHEQRFVEGFSALGRVVKSL
jgi:phage N-6-adenine-methyltransferase